MNWSVERDRNVGRVRMNDLYAAQSIAAYRRSTHLVVQTALTGILFLVAGKPIL